MATNWLRTGVASSSSNVGDQGDGGVKRSATGEKVVPNEEALVDVGGMRGEEKPVVEGLEDQMEAVLLRLLSKHGHLLRAAESAESTGAPTASSSTSKMVEQGCQTELVGDVIPVSKRARNKVSFAGESGDLLTGEVEETAPVAATKSSILVVGDAEGVVPVAMVMSEGEIQELEAARIQQESDEDLYAGGGGKASQAADLPIVDCDGKTWERHFHEDGREYFYCLDTGDTQWVLPKKTGMAGNSEGPGVGMGIVPVEDEPTLGATSSPSSTESSRAQQGSMESVNSGVNSVSEKDFSSTIGDSGPRGGGDAPTSGSPDEEGISGNRADIAEAQHLDREEMGMLSEGVAAVESVGPEEKMPNVEIGIVSAAEERVVDVVPVVQEDGPGDLDDEEKKLCITTEEVSSFGAEKSAIQREKETSETAGDTVDKKDEAWSANEARVDAPDSTWSANEKRVEVHMVVRSTGDCNNGAQVSAAADDGGSQVDALVQPEISREERNDKDYTGANEAAVVNDGGNSPLETMEPKEPAVEESVPAVDDQLNRPAAEENLPAAEGVTKDTNEGSTPMKGEALPSGSSPEVDTERTEADEAKPLAEKKGSPEIQEHKKDELVGLVEQDEQCDPKVKTKDAPGADDTEMVSEEHAKRVPRAGALESPGTHCYEEGDKITGLVRCINGYGAFLDYGDLNVLIPAEGNNVHQFQFGDTVNGTVKRVEDDGTIILDTFLVLEENEEDSSPKLRKWKDSGWGTWWTGSWQTGQWYKGSDGQWDWKSEEPQSREWFAESKASSREQEEAEQKQLYGEKICRNLLEDETINKDYVGKITGMLLSRSMDVIVECIADHAFLNNEARSAYNILLSDGWKPEEKERVGVEETTTFSRKQYHDALYELARKKRRFSGPVVGEAVAMLLSKGKDELWNELWLDTKRFLQELDGAVEEMSKRENRPIETYMDPDQYKKAHTTPKTVSLGYSKLCRFFNQGRCRNGDGCSYEHRRYGEGWPEGEPTEAKNSQKTGDEDGDIGGPPTDEGTVDEVQQEREDSAFRAQYNYGKGTSKGEPTLGETKKRLCLYYNQSGCKYGTACRFLHDDDVALEGTWEPGKSWDNASRRAIRDAGFHQCCFDYYLKGRCRVRFGCKYSHEEMSEDRLAQLKHLVNVANHVSFQRAKGLEIPDRNAFQPPVSGGAESSSSSAPKALQMTNVSQKDGEKGILDEEEADEQKNSVAASTSTQLHNPEEPIENWMARNQHLWVYTPHVSEVMITLGVTNVSDLQEFIFVEDLVDKGINKVTACKILQLVGEVRYRPGGPEKAVPSDASVRVQQSSGNKGTGRAAVRTLTQVREAEDSGAKTMPRGSYRELFDKVKYRDAWTLAQRSPLCVQKLKLVGVGMPPVNPPTKKYRSRSNPVKRGRPLLDKKQVRQVPRSRSQRRAQPAEVVEKPKPLELKPRGGLSYRFSRAWADVVDDDDQAEALVSYAASSSDSSTEETNAVHRMREILLQERDSQRTAIRGNVPMGGSSGPNAGQKKSVHLGKERDKASRGETRQEVTSQVFSLPQPSRRTEQSQKRARDGSVMVGSLAVGSTDEVLPGQGVAGQVNGSESAQVLPGHEVAGQETALEGAVQIPGEETDQNEGEGGSNDLRGDDAKNLDGGLVRSDLQQLLVKGLLNRIYWKVAVGKLPVGQRDCQKGSNKMDRNLVISMSSEGASEQDENLALEDDADQSMGDGAMVVLVYDPSTLIQSPTTDWVMRRGLTDRSIWPAMAYTAQRICAEMVQVDELNAQLNTGRLLFERRDQGYYCDLHHSFHDNPCLPVVGNYPLSVMGALLSPGLEKEFRDTGKFGTAMEAIAYDWSRSPGMEVHVELMARVANLVAPFLKLGGQGTVVNSEFLWQHGRDQMMEFLQAATCADQLEVLWRRMDDDADEEVDPTGMVLEIPDQQDAVLDQGNNESLIPIEDVGGETLGDTGRDGKAPEVSPEEETSSGSSRLAGTRIFLWSVYSRVASNFSTQDRTTGKIFDSTKGYPGEGPNNGDNPSSKRNLPWISEDYLDEVVSKKMERSSDMDGLEGSVPGSEGSLEKVEVENVTASNILMALWKKGSRAGYRRLCRLNVSGCKVATMQRPIKRVQKIGTRKALMKKFNVFGSSQHGSGVGGKPIMKVVGPRPGFPAVLQAPTTDSTSGEGSSPQVHGNVHVEHNRPMDRYEAERLEKRKKGFCYWFSKGKDRCKFGEDCKFIHSEDDVVLHSYWCKYYVAGRDCFAGKDCAFSHDATGVRCIQFARSGKCRYGDRCVFEHGVPLDEQRPRSPRTPPRDGPRRGSGANGGEKEISPEQFDDGEEYSMTYDDDTKMSELLMEAISILSNGKPDLARAEADPLFKLLKFKGDADQMDREWVSWTDEMLSVLELHEVVKSYDVSLEEVEEWVNDLRIWFERANLEEEKDPKRGKKRSLERESSKDIPAEKEVVETSETEVIVEEEAKKVKKKRKPVVIEDPYTLLVPKPKKMPATIEKSGSLTNAAVSAGEKASRMRAKSIVGGKAKKKEKSQSPKKGEVVVVKGPEEKDRPPDVDEQASAAVSAELGQPCQAIEDAKREGLVSSIQRGVQDPALTVSDLEYILLQLHLKIANNRKKK